MFQPRNVLSDRKLLFEIFLRLESKWKLSVGGINLYINDTTTNRTAIRPNITRMSFRMVLSLCSGRFIKASRLSTTSGIAT